MTKRKADRLQERIQRWAPKLSVTAYPVDDGDYIMFFITSTGGLSYQESISNLVDANTMFNIVKSGVAKAMIRRQQLADAN